MYFLRNPGDGGRDSSVDARHDAAAEPEGCDADLQVTKGEGPAAVALKCSTG